MKKKFSYIYEISVDNLEISEKMRYYSTRKDAVEVALKLGLDVSRRFFGNDNFLSCHIDEDNNPIKITIFNGNKQNNANVKRVPVNETIEGKEIKIYWD